MVAHGPLVKAVHAVHASEWALLGRRGLRLRHRRAHPLDELPAKGTADILVLALVVVVLAFGLEEALLRLASALLKLAQLLVELDHLAVGLGHEVIVLVDLLLKRLQHALDDTGAVETVDGATSVRDTRGLWPSLLLLVCGLLHHGLRATVLRVGALAGRRGSVGSGRWWVSLGGGGPTAGRSGLATVLGVSRRLLLLLVWTLVRAVLERRSRVRRGHLLLLALWGVAVGVGVGA